MVATVSSRTGRLDLVGEKKEREEGRPLTEDVVLLNIVGDC